jgi:hypothetical protein
MVLVDEGEGGPHNRHDECRADSMRMEGKDAYGQTGTGQFRSLERN